MSMGTYRDVRGISKRLAVVLFSEIVRSKQTIYHLWPSILIYIITFSNIHTKLKIWLPTMLLPQKSQKVLNTERRSGVLVKTCIINNKIRSKPKFLEISFKF